MDLEYEISSSEDEIWFWTVEKQKLIVFMKKLMIEIMKVVMEIVIVLGVRNRKIRIVDSESDSDIPQDFNNAEWIPCEILSRIKFVTREKPAGVTDILKYWITVGFFKNISY